MKKFISRIDFAIALFLKKYADRPWLNRFLSRINRGEILLLVFLLTLYLYLPEKIPFWFIILFIGGMAYLTDRFVFLVKKKVSRERPLLSVSGKVDKNPDMKHSFPSAHSANSMTVLFILVFGFGFPPALLLLSLLAGVGRLLSLHHFFSDVMGGWIIGFCFGCAGVLILDSTNLFFH